MDTWIRFRQLTKIPTDAHVAATPIYQGVTYRLATLYYTDLVSEPWERKLKAHVSLAKPRT
eukprot:3910659-Pleurochrysis_carterae.AAC.1